MGTTSEPALLAGSLVVRNALEPLVAAEAVMNAAPDDLWELNALLAEMDVNRDEPTSFLLANWALHRRLAQVGDNPVLARVYESTLDVAQERIDSVLAGTDFAARVTRTIAVHGDLLAAIADRDLEAAADATARHTPVVRALST